MNVYKPESVNIESSIRIEMLDCKLIDTQVAL